MTTDKKEQKNKGWTLSSWAAAGLAIGFACGYVVLDSVLSGIILGVGLAFAMDLAAKGGKSGC